ncbi:ABC transporter ATP-binding protein [Agaricicola taiwanensis]|uniref:ABC transporter ATP-binding protein n=1 Tax=Agaricicola taiwanensis TaxID=591372 RepID=A0A8J2YC71_9RHOB|nr:flagellar hook-length control protein FliK [Agaricicola taiwanensis]GGE29936.1 ABC transporter ATP-binding protein [Agaricicola taiwanensis]
MSDASILSNLASQASGGQAASVPVLKAGQVVAAQVLALMKDGIVRLALPQGTIDVVPPMPLTQGAGVKLEVVKTGAELVLRLIDPEAVPDQPAKPAALPAAPLPAPQTGAAMANPARPGVSAPVLPQNIPVDLPAGLEPELKPTAGRPIEGRVIALDQKGAVRIATPQGDLTVNVRLPVPLGAAVRIEAPQRGTPMLSVISASSPAVPGPATVSAPVLPGTGQAVTPRPAAVHAPAPGATVTPVSLALPSSPAPPATVVTAQLASPSPALATSPGSAPVLPASALANGSAPVVAAAAPPSAVRTLPASPVAAAPLPSGPMRIILLPALQTAMGQQQGMAPLMANLEAAAAPSASSLSAPPPPAPSSPIASSTAVLDAPGAERAVPALPPTIAAAAAKVLGARLPLDRPVTGEDIARALADSGVMFEAKLAAGAPPAQVAGDLKGALLLLRNALKSFLGDTAMAGPEALATSKDAPSPPLRGDPPSAQRPATATIDAEAAPEEIGRTLLQQTEGALARTRLSQIASLPDDSTPLKPAGPAPLHVEIPVVLGQQNAVAQFTVERDGSGRADEARTGSLWRMRFALDVEPMGPVHALVTLRGEAATVTLWAERPETASELSAASSDLRRSLDDAAFAVEDVVVRRGAPPKPARPPGGMLDRRT